VHDSFVLREAGRRETVAGGEVLDIDPPSRPGSGVVARLSARAEADRPALAWRLVVDRGTVRVSDVMVLTGAPAAQAIARGAVALDGWLAAPELVEDLGARLSASLAEFHRRHPLRPGLEIAEARSLLADLRPAFSDPDLADALLGHLAAENLIARDATVIRLPSHSLSTAGLEDADRLVEAVRVAEPSPPSVKELVESGFDLELIRAVCAEGRLVRVSHDIVLTPGFVAQAEAVVRSTARSPGLTVSAFKEALGTSRKYALPILEYFDAKGVTRRQGDFRVARGG
jgi:selenocysteine-specific elongation factor